MVGWLVIVLTSYQQLRSCKDGLPVYAKCMFVVNACVFGRLRYVRVKARYACRLYSATSLKHTAEGPRQHTPPGHIILATGEPVVPFRQC